MSWNQKKRKKSKKIYAMGDLLGGALSRAGVVGQVGAAMIIQAFDVILEEKFGDGVLEYARGRSFKDGVLFVACTNAAMAQEIDENRQFFILRVTEALPAANLEDVVAVFRESAGRRASWYDGGV